MLLRSSRLSTASVSPLGAQFPLLPLTGHPRTSSGSLDLYWNFLNNYKSHIFKKDFIYLFLEKGREKKRERNINVWLPLVHPLLETWCTTQACALTGNRTGDPLVHRPALNPLSHTSQGQKSHSFYNKWT